MRINIINEHESLYRKIKTMLSLMNLAMDVFEDDSETVEIIHIRLAAISKKLADEVAR